MTLKEAIAELKELKLCIIGRSQRIWIDREACEAIDTVIAEVEKPTYTAEDMEAFFSWATNNGWSYGELTELWYNDDEELEALKIEEVLKLWEEQK